MLEHQIAITIFKDETQSFTFYIEQILLNANCHIFLPLVPVKYHYVFLNVVPISFFFNMSLFYLL